MFTIDIKVEKQPWMSNPKLRWNSGLKAAGINFRQMQQREHYPPIPAGSKYKRTYTFANQANFRITSEGEEMEFGSVNYGVYLFIPARTVQHWGPHKDETIQKMKEGFAYGVKNFEEF